MVFAAALDGVVAHLPDIEQQFVAIAGGVVQHGVVKRDGVVDRLAEQPFLWGYQVCGGAAGDESLGDERDFRGGGAADDLGQEADHVMKVCCGAEAAVIPGRVDGAGAFGIAGFAFDVKPVCHGGADGVEAGHDEGVEYIIKRVAVGRSGEDRAGGSCLVVVIHDLGDPFDEELAAHVPGLLQVKHVEVTVVIVAGIFFPKPRGDVLTSERCSGLGLHIYQSGTSSWPSRVGVGQEDDDIIEDCGGSRGPGG